ncbi:MAG TPA: SHOCT domain-containing protein [Ferruginibacter sp.]|nr:SHOCT domain-containing protein [Ferruginibacter sp.]
MKRLLFILLLYPFILPAQKTLPRFENDTLFTSSGFKIYKGLTLKFGKGSGRNGAFRFINIKNGATQISLANASMVIKELKNYGISIFYNGYIEITGTITFKDGSKGYLDIHMAFDRAIENSLKLTSELAVPDEFRNRPGGNISDEIMKLYKLYKQGDLTEEEYEDQKKKILEGS